MSFETDNYLLSHQLLRRGFLIEQSPLGITLSDNALLTTRFDYCRDDIQFLKRVLKALHIRFDYQLESTGIENIIVQEQFLTEQQIQRLFPEIELNRESGYNNYNLEFKWFKNRTHMPKIALSELEPYVAILVKGLSATGCGTWGSCMGHLDRQTVFCWLIGQYNGLWAEQLLNDARQFGITGFKVAHYYCNEYTLTVDDASEHTTEKQLKRARELAIQLGLHLYQHRIRLRSLRREFIEQITPPKIAKT